MFVLAIVSLICLGVTVTCIVYICMLCYFCVFVHQLIYYCQSAGLERSARTAYFIPEHVGESFGRRAQLYIQTPDQPHQRPLCYNLLLILPEDLLLEEDPSSLSRQHSACSLMNLQGCRVYHTPPIRGG